MRSPDPLPLRVCLGLVRLFAVLVPRASRREWLAEWESEFRHRHAQQDARGEAGWRGGVDLVRRAPGALPDAAWLRRQFTMDAEIVHDGRHGLRMLRQSPTFAFAAIGILALGLGGTLAIASLLDTLFFRPLPYADADRVVTVWQKPEAGPRGDVAPANFLDWRERSRSFSQLAAVVPYSYDYTGAGEPEVFFGAQVTEGFVDVVGLQPLHGRGFLPEEHVRGGRKVAMITYGLWQRRFGGDPGIVNRAVSLDGVPFTVIGVWPPEFRPQLLPRPGEISVWTPKVIQDHERRIRDSAWWNVVGRLRAGTSLEEAQADMVSIATALGREHPRTNEHVGIEVISLRDHLMGDVRLPLLIMLAAVIVVLAIGCANVASLLLARGLEREREFAIRAALGAGRGRLVRQLVMESLLLSVIAAGAGVGLAHWLITGIVALAPAGVLRLQDAALDGRMLMFATLLTVATAVTFGLLPALQVSRSRRDVMRERQPGSPRGGARRILVTAEIALALVLLTSAGLLIRSFERLMAVDPGFSPRNTVALQVFAYDRNPTAAKLRTFFSTALDRLNAIPGVESAGAVSAMPFASANIDIKSTLDVPGRPGDAHDRPGVYVTIATPGFFRTLRVPLKEGRFLDERDSEKGPVVSVISDALRRREWPNESPIGKRIRVDWQGKPLESEIVGVVSQIRHEGLDSTPRPEVFLHNQQVPFGSMTFVVRGAGPAGELVSASRQAIWSVDPLQTFYETGSVEAMVSASVVRQRFSTTLLTGFAVIALLLSAIGLYGVISFATSQRTREIGVRMALGADRGTIRAMVLREGGSVIVVGIAAGLVGSLAATRYLQRLLFEVEAIDPPTLIAVCLLLSTVALAACYLPARRATRVDPVVALRNE
jgi:putative ABC transport system permease protein